MSTSASKIVRWLAWSVGLGLTVFLIHRVGLRAIGHAMGRVGVRFVWILAAYAAATAVNAIPWGLLLPRRARPSWSAVLTSRFAASGLSALLPFFGLGEAGRLLWMPRLAWPSGTAAIVVDRLIFLIAGAIFLLGAVGSARSLGSLPHALTTGAVIVAVAIVVVTAGVAVGAAHGQLGRAWNGLGRLVARHRARPDACPPVDRPPCLGAGAARAAGRAPAPPGR